MKKIALIIGASSDIAHAVCNNFLNHDYTVLLIVKTNNSKLKTLKKINKKFKINHDYFMYTCDISNNSKTLICNHVYHRNCINTWLFNANTCPICRRIIQEENVTTTTTFNVPETVRQSRYVVRNTHTDLFSPSYNVSPRTDLDRYRHTRSLDTIRNRYNFS